MDALPVALILASAFMHAGWNLLARRQRSEATFFWRMQLPVVVVCCITCGAFYRKQYRVHPIHFVRLTPILGDSMPGSNLPTIQCDFHRPFSLRYLATPG